MAQVEVLQFCAFYNEGIRGAFGGAAQNDKIWGIGRVQGTLVTFWGRRNGRLRFKTQPNTQSNRNDLMTQYGERCSNRRNRDRYTPVSNLEMRETLCPDLTRQIERNFYSGLSRGTLNTMAA
jgi:hypothetical protein